MNDDPVSDYRLAPQELLIGGQGLHFSYHGAPTLEGIDISIRRREIVTLVGPNGAGKSTLAKLLMGVLKPKAGRLKRAKGLIVGYVPQHLSLDPTMPITVRRFLTLGKGAAGTVSSALDALNIAHLADKQLTALSGGQRQRVLLARALSRRPDLLVLDEPEQSLDLEGQAELSTLLDAQRQAGAGILLISHDLSFVLSCTDRVLCIDRTVCCAGSPDGLLDDPAYHRVLGPRAAEALALYRQRAAGAEAVVSLERRSGRV